MKEKKYFKNGNIKLVTSYKKGKKEGEELEYHNNGKLKRKVSYEKGRKEGIEEIFFPKGILKKSICYRNGREEFSFDKLQIKKREISKEDEREYELYDVVGNYVGRLTKTKEKEERYDKDDILIKRKFYKRNGDIILEEYDSNSVTTTTLSEEKVSVEYDSFTEYGDILCYDCIHYNEGSDEGHEEELKDSCKRCGVERYSISEINLYKNGRLMVRERYRNVSWTENEDYETGLKDVSITPEIYCVEIYEEGKIRVKNVDRRTEYVKVFKYEVDEIIDEDDEYEIEDEVYLELDEKLLLNLGIERIFGYDSLRDQYKVNDHIK